MNSDDPNYRDLFEIVARSAQAIQKMEPEERAEWIGPHLSPVFLQAYGEGQVDYEAAHEETRHLIYCSPCAREVTRFERLHLEKLRGEQELPVFLPIGQFENQLEERMAARVSVSEPIPDAVAPVLYCRGFQMDLLCRQNSIVLSIGVDDVAEIGDIEVRDRLANKVLQLQKNQKPGRIDLVLGSISALDGREVRVSFEYDQSTWTKVLVFREPG